MKKTNLTLSIALAAVFSASTAFAEAEVTGKFVHESAKLVDGAKSAIKTESTVRIYIDGEAEGIAEGATYHVELQGHNDSSANYSSDAAYTQRDPLREAYVDMQQGDWSIRAGKQQVVWGTADGMKLLDMINPTDYAEMAQNQMEDSRIPVWMVNAEKDNLQVVVSQAKENVFAGLNRGTDTAVRSNGAIPVGQMMAADTAAVGTDTDSAFLMMGPESITGATNGFLNITPDLGSVAAGFGTAFMPITTPPATQGGLGGLNATGDDVMSDLLSAFTVNAFTSGATLGELSGQFVQMQQGKAGYYASLGVDGIAGTADDLDITDATDAGTIFTAMNAAPTMGFSDLNFAAMVAGGACAKGYGPMYGLTCAADGSTSAADFNILAAGTDGADGIAGNADDAPAMTGIQALNDFGEAYGTNLSSFGDGEANSAFEYMGNTGFRTFDTFVNARSQYKYSMPSDSDVNLAFRTQESTADGVNYSMNYSYNYDTNPIIDLSWRNDAGEVLKQETVSAALGMLGVNPGADGISGTADDFLISNADMITAGHTTDGVNSGTYIQLTDSTYDAVNSNDNTHADFQKGIYGGKTGQSAILTFDQKVKRVHNIGGSFDTSIETAELGPVVIRGEALYTKDGYSPVMNKAALSQGDLVGALQMKKADRFKFVLGADITAMTNMLVSAQFIQDSNLDFVDNGDEYTTDYATMHLSNGFNKATKDKNFYSLFFSKPFGASGEHRWNNITMYEEGNGNWNRFDIDYSIDDDTQATLEYNKYWGNVNTQFGQLKNASNIQAGIKYSF